MDPEHVCGQAIRKVTSVQFLYRAITRQISGNAVVPSPNNTKANDFLRKQN